MELTWIFEKKPWFLRIPALIFRSKGTNFGGLGDENRRYDGGLPILAAPLITEGGSDIASKDGRFWVFLK